MPFELKNIDNIPLLTLPDWEMLGFKVVSTTCTGGQDYRLWSEVDWNRRKACYDRLLAATGLPHNIVANKQVHGTYIRYVTAADCVTEQPYLFQPTQADGLITAEYGITLLCFTADCTPVIVADPIHRAIGIAHAGWRGTAAGIALRLVESLCSCFGSEPGALIAAIAPCIGPECYEVDTPVITAMQQNPAYNADWFIRDGHDNAHAGLRLSRANADQLIYAGLKPENITEANMCTCCSTLNGEPMFHSHRRVPENGLNGTFISLLP